MILITKNRKYRFKQGGLCSMKKLHLLSFILLGITTFPNIKAQSKLVLNDRSGLITSEVESLLKDRFEGDDIELTSIVNFKKKCDYWFASAYIQNNELVLSVDDCNEKSAGIKNLGTKIITAIDTEKALLIYFAISEIIIEPVKSLPAEEISPKELISPPQLRDTPLEKVDPGIHKTRYFFSPSSFTLEEGELYYNTLYFFLHDVQYGVSNNFSIGMGTTVSGWPFYLTPKLSIPVNDISTFAIGDLLMIGTWGTNFLGNLLYTTYTRGGERKNFTIGGGYLFTSEGDVTSKSHTPVLNLSGLAEFSDHIYFITENYVSQVSLKETATNINDYREETFNRNIFAIFGMTGFRFINRKNDTNSWQLGLTYLFTSFGPVPAKYNPALWYVDQYEEDNFITFPVIGYTRKFGMRY